MGTDTLVSFYEAMSMALEKEKVRSGFLRDNGKMECKADKERLLFMKEISNALRDFSLQELLQVEESRYSEMVRY